ncbi:MAG: hypothetical protein HYV15_01465 [Elusimicrobia bacterium]|nr:hypothetical protein [Elusimicrobiota bacterium]
MRRAAALLGLALANPAAAQDYGAAAPALIRPGGFLLFYDSQGALSFVSATRSELPGDAVDAGTVTASACQHGLSVPLSLSLRANSVSAAAGRGGFEKALSRLKDARPELRGVYDVKVDTRVTSVLRIWRRLCIEVSARGFR